MKLFPTVVALAFVLGGSVAVTAATSSQDWPKAPLTLEQSLDVALSQNPAIQKGRKDLNEAYGIALQLKSVALPKIAGTGSYTAVDSGKIESAPFGPGGVRFRNDQSWSADITVSQTLFDAGKTQSSLRSAKLTREAAMQNFESLVADTLLQVRIGYQDILLAAEQIVTQQASVKLLEQELSDTQRRFDAGTVPQFNVLRSTVELANARPRLIKARNDLRIAKNNFATLLGWNVPKDASEDIPLELAGKLQASSDDTALAAAIARAFSQRTELAAARLNEKLKFEEIKQAKADYYPRLSASAGYGWANRVFGEQIGQSPALSDEVHGWSAGVTANWSIWDSGLTRGKVKAAEAHREKAAIDVEDLFRRIEQEVRTAHSNLVQARETLESQAKVIEQAEEAVRLAVARADAGSGTLLDVLSAQTALTDSRTTYAVTLHDYTVAQARLDRAMGEGVSLRKGK
jgi:outer membrane protein TolC